MSDGEEGTERSIMAPVVFRCTGGRLGRGRGGATASKGPQQQMWRVDLHNTIWRLQLHCVLMCTDIFILSPFKCIQSRHININSSPPDMFVVMFTEISIPLPWPGVEAIPDITVNQEGTYYL